MAFINLGTMISSLVRRKNENQNINGVEAKHIQSSFWSRPAADWPNCSTAQDESSNSKRRSIFNSTNFHEAYSAPSIRNRTSKSNKIIKL